MDEDLIKLLALVSDKPDATDVARWVFFRFSKEHGTWASKEPDEEAFEKADTPQDTIDRIIRMDGDVVDMMQCYMDRHSSIEWATLMACLVAEQQIRIKMMERVNDSELDADKQQRAYTLKCDLAEKLIDMRSRHSKLAQDIIGTGAVGNQAARLIAMETRRKVTPEGRSRETPQ